MADYIYARDKNTTRILIGNCVGEYTATTAAVADEDGTFRVYTAMAGDASAICHPINTLKRKIGAFNEVDSRPTTCVENELDYGPGFVQRLRARFLQMANVNAPNVEVSPHIRRKRFPSTGDVFTTRAKTFTSAPLRATAVEMTPDFATPCETRRAQFDTATAKTFSTMISCGFSLPNDNETTFICPTNTLPTSAALASSQHTRTTRESTAQSDNSLIDAPKRSVDANMNCQKNASTAVPSSPPVCALEVKSISARVAEYWQNSTARKRPEASERPAAASLATTATRFSALREKFEQISRADAKDASQCDARKWGRSRSTHFDEIAFPQYDTYAFDNRPFATTSLKRRGKRNSEYDGVARPATNLSASSPPADPQPAETMKALFAYVIGIDEPTIQPPAMLRAGNKTPPPDEPMPSIQSGHSTNTIQLNVNRNTIVDDKEAIAKLNDIKVEKQRQEERVDSTKENPVNEPPTVEKSASDCAGLSEVRQFLSRFSDQRRRREHANISPPRRKISPTKAPEYRIQLRTRVTQPPYDAAATPDVDSIETKTFEDNGALQSLSAVVEFSSAPEKTAISVGSAVRQYFTPTNNLESKNLQREPDQPAAHNSSEHETLHHIVIEDVREKIDSIPQPKSQEDNNNALETIKTTNTSAPITVDATSTVKVSLKSRELSLPVDQPSDLSLEKYAAETKARNSFSTMYFENNCTKHTVDADITSDALSLISVTPDALNTTNSSQSEERDATDRIATDGGSDFIVDDDAPTCDKSATTERQQAVETPAYDNDSELSYCPLDIQRIEANRPQECQQAFEYNCYENVVNTDQMILGYDMIVDFDNNYDDNKDYNNNNSFNNLDNNIAFEKNKNNSEILDEIQQNNNHDRTSEYITTNERTVVDETKEKHTVPIQESEFQTEKEATVFPKSENEEKINENASDALNDEIINALWRQEADNTTGEYVDEEEDEELRAWRADDPFSSALKQARQYQEHEEARIFDDVDFERVASPPFAGHLAACKLSLLTADGCPIRHSLLSLVMDEDIPDLLEAMAEEHNFVFEDYWTMAASTSSIIVQRTADCNDNRNQKRKKANVRISFEDAPPRVFAYLDEASALAENYNSWPTAQTISFDDYQRIVQRTEDELIQQQMELAEWQRGMQSNNENVANFSNSLAESLNRMTMTSTQENTNPFENINATDFAVATPNNVVFPTQKAMLPA